MSSNQNPPLLYSCFCLESQAHYITGTLHHRQVTSQARYIIRKKKVMMMSMFQLLMKCNYKKNRTVYPRRVLVPRSASFSSVWHQTWGTSDSTHRTKEVGETLAPIITHCHSLGIKCIRNTSLSWYLFYFLEKIPNNRVTSVPLNNLIALRKVPAYKHSTS